MEPYSSCQTQFVIPSKPTRVTIVDVFHFLGRLLGAVILLVLIRSPMYFCRNLLLLSSLLCSSLTASIRWKRANSESWSAFACLSFTVSLPTIHSCAHAIDGSQSSAVGTHLCNSSLASLLNISRSWLVLLGLMALTSSGPSAISTGPTSMESRGTIMVPLLFRLGNRGLIGTGAWITGCSCWSCCWSSDAPDDESDHSMPGTFPMLLSSIMLSIMRPRRAAVLV